MIRTFSWIFWRAQLGKRKTWRTRISVQFILQFGGYQSGLWVWWLEPGGSKDLCWTYQRSLGAPSECSFSKFSDVRWSHSTGWSDGPGSTSEVWHPICFQFQMRVSLQINFSHEKTSCLIHIPQNYMNLTKKFLILQSLDLSFQHCYYST